MNTLIKILAAIALIAVTVAAVVHVITRLNGTDTKPGPSGGGNPTTGKVGQGDHEPKPGKSRVVAKSGETIKVGEDDSILPKHPIINRPVILQNLREEGKIYSSAVIGKVTGRAKKRDWGAAQATAYFNYVYTMKTTGRILQNDGRTIVEERSFDNVGENLVVSDISVGLSLSGKGTVSKLIDRFIGTATNGLVSGPDVVEFANRVVQFNNVSEKTLDYLGFDITGMKGRVKMFSKVNKDDFLEGKKVRIVFRDGKGITEITPIGCKLSDEECDIIKRTNYVMDHYLMPDTEVAVGGKWKINADVFSGLIDPRLEGKIKGEITVERIADFRQRKKGVNKRMRLTDGQIDVVDPGKEGGIVKGEITQVRGMAIRPDEHGVVTSAGLQGYVQYKEVSRHHLLFDATMETEPRFEVEYECEVKDN